MPWRREQPQSGAPQSRNRGRTCGSPSEGLTRWLLARAHRGTAGPGPLVPLRPSMGARHDRTGGGAVCLRRLKAQQHLSLGMFMSRYSTCGCPFFLQDANIARVQEDNVPAAQDGFSISHNTAKCSGHARKIILRSRKLLVLDKTVISSCSQCTPMNSSSRTGNVCTMIHIYKYIHPFRPIVWKGILCQ